MYFVEIVANKDALFYECTMLAEFTIIHSIAYVVFLTFSFQLLCSECSHIKMMHQMQQLLQTPNKS